MVDITFLKRFTKENPNKMKRYISLYLDIAPKTIREMSQSLENKDWEQLRIHAHSLKPQADFMGIPSLKNTLIAIEEAVKQDNIGEIENLFDIANSLSLKSELALKEILDTI